MIQNPVIWPAMGGIALAVGIGVQLGDSAIRDINPIHFQGPAARPAGIAPVADAPPPSPYQQAYGWDQGNAARLADGGNVDYPYAPTPTVHFVADPAWQAETPPLSLPPWPPGRVSAHPDVERYTDFPIERKRPTEPEADAPAEDKPADGD
jgi:hypothetical protein